MKPTSSVPRLALRSLARSQSPLHRSQHIRPLCRPTTSSRIAQPLLSSRQFSSTPKHHKGLSPGSSDPAPPNTEPHPEDQASASPADLSDSHYHEIADEYLNNLVLALEEKAETSSDIEVEYSAGVLTLSTPRGTYILNKQPPNKQIWLSSPVSGPKRFDWVLPSSNHTQYEKQDTEDGDEAGDDGSGGKWVYLRDRSGLSEILRREVDVRIGVGGEEGEESGS